MVELVKASADRVPVGTQVPFRQQSITRGRDDPPSAVCLVVFTLAAGATVAAVTAAGWQLNAPWSLALLLFAIAAIAELEAIPLIEGRITLSAVPIILGGLLGGPVLAVVVALARVVNRGWKTWRFPMRICDGFFQAVAAGAVGLAFADTDVSRVDSAVALSALATFAAMTANVAQTMVLVRAMGYKPMGRILRSTLLVDGVGLAIVTPLIAALLIGYRREGAALSFLVLLALLAAAAVARCLVSRVAAREVDLEAEIEATRDLAYTDALTGARNRRWFDDALQHELGHAHRKHSTVGLLFIDVDGFKAINDSHGHEGGDAVLAEVVRRLGTRLRANDVVIRWGGDELAVLVADIADEAELERLANDLRLTIAEGSVVLARESVSVTCSIGATLHDPLIDHVETLVPTADRALYASKARGRNAVTLAR